jgi:hypothetical protein
MVHQHILGYNSVGEKLGNEEASLETWACCYSTDEAWWRADKCFAAYDYARLTCDWVTNLLDIPA